MKEYLYIIKGTGAIVTPTLVPRGPITRCKDSGCYTLTHSGGLCSVCAIVKKVGYTMADCRGV